MVTIAHLTDIHMPFQTYPKLRHLALKQMLGLTNWRLNRQTIHTHLAIETLLSDLKQQTFDHILVSGDLTNIGIESEYQAAQAFLKRLGDPEKLSVLAGNHDLCDQSSAPYIQTYWGEYLGGNDAGRQIYTPKANNHPYVTRIDNIALIGVNSAIATRPFCAQGLVGERQRNQLAQILRHAKSLGLYTIIALHHPPVKGLTKPSRALRDEADFEQLLIEEGADLVLYGHNHLYQETNLTTSHGICKIIGAPSFSVGAQSHYDMGAYHLIKIDPSADGDRRLDVERRSLTQDGMNVTSLPYPDTTS